MEIIKAAVSFAKEKMSAFDGGHDWFHSERVLNLSKHIQKKEGKGDLLVIELAAILHDIADTKFHSGSENDGGDMAYDFLLDHEYPKDDADHVRRIINNISFKKRLEKETINTIEYQIVQDADRIDAIGAIGIARAFNYGGYKNRPLYDPSIPLVNYVSMEEYKNSPAPTINHFYEKLFLLKDLMNTPTAKALAKERHDYMLEFVKRFMSEYDGEI
ncbi:HD domain-containing protein [Bacteroidota bacterium]